ncbi:translesion error-prone DNA polymerase V autoproteolytic subunit [Nitrincola tapanii]|uniref:Translesion error-prone DNA polymerase V autoproteolytic subunit n=1 Tax=Nitrincola tapanii TaxID=1708751 RepID=A0A5A9W7G5_9GAMM|nr:translesion error-prone DNA polymerase V autoproteolytic subunit [Nitrincola tapanii]KAA0876473.1 translesion error-prone DNA polymerase V autoproteolytic subunit [Nitrincola tapanii]
MTVTLLGSVDVDALSKTAVPFYSESVPCGFPSPAAGYEDTRLDLNELCIPRPSSTYMVRCDGDSMNGIGIFAGDILVVDRSIKAKHGDTVVAAVDGAFTVKTLALKPKVQLLPQNRRYAPIEIKEGSDLQLFGVVTHLVRAMQR